MAIMPIRLFGDPVLREGGRPVTEFDADLARLAENMIETMDAAHGAGLAAPQVGVLLRMFVHDCGGNGPEVVINPELSDPEGLLLYDEGCLSLPGIFVEVERPEWITCRYQDLSGDWHEVRADGLLGRVYQHESDHIDGRFFIEHASKSDRRQALREFRKSRWANETVWVPDPSERHRVDEHSL